MLCRDGSIGKQYKIHITPSERKWWGVNPGDKVEVFDTNLEPVAGVDTEQFTITVGSAMPDGAVDFFDDSLLELVAMA